eukprot:gb/GECH01012825.1/.p1 GENE.gb/GECH01012825.1/~~gb/GECH01012825.1/.p1  ORF type:complete len:252 (+),score=74.13 gb/GECH01012825.1/:1-756(+)
MQNDEVVWNIIRSYHCSYRINLPQQGKKLCQHEMNPTGLCNRASCPIANSQFATVLENKGKLWLYIKTPERQHTPRHQWQKVLLDDDFRTAMKQVNDRLAYWPHSMVAKCKARVARLREVILRKKRLEKQQSTEIVTRRNRSKEKQLTRRERRAERFARVEQQIEKELLRRLREGTYGDIYNFEKENEKKLDDQLEELSDGEEEPEEDMDIEDFPLNYQFEEEDYQLSKSAPNVELEYEQETVPDQSNQDY